jgi:DNA-binding phage protein
MHDQAARKTVKKILLFIARQQEKSGLTIRQFAAEAGIARHCLYQWSVGENTPNILSVVKALDAAGYEIAIRRKADDAERDG